MYISKSRRNLALATLLLGLVTLLEQPVCAQGKAVNNAFFEQPYFSQILSTFGTPPYTYQVTGGALPPGITLSSSGRFSGTATALGAFPFTVQITDSSQPPQRQLVGYSLAVLLGIDTYGGLTALPSNGGASGYFRLEHAGNRWNLVSPNGNAFYMNAVMNATPGFIEPAIMQSRYANNTTLWSQHRGQRMQSWGFNTLGEYVQQTGLPVGTWGGHVGNPVRQPFILLFPTSADAYNSPARLGLPQGIKNITQGIPLTTYNGYQGRLLDVFDPEWQQAYTLEMANLNQAITGGFANVPWIVGITTEDADFFWALKSNGTNGWAKYPHPAFLIACTNFNFPGYQDGKLWSKYAWVAYLQSEYGTIQNLNAAWGTNGFYTAFGDDGGFGVGTGVLDEDGRHTSWMGSDPYNLAGENSVLQADMNNFLYQYVYQLESVAVNTIRSYDSNHLIFAPSALGGDGCGSQGGAIRPQVIQALSDAGVNAFSVCYFPSDPTSINSSKAIYDQVGKPVISWYAVAANADSYWHGYTGDYAIPQYATQSLRGAQYQSGQALLYNATSTSGDNYILGIDFWSLTDSGTAEKTNFGLTSDKDNTYNGREAVITGGTDAWGFPTGGETANYGDSVDTMVQTNAATFTQFVLDLLSTH